MIVKTRVKLGLLASALALTLVAGGGAVLAAGDYPTSTNEVTILPVKIAQISPDTPVRSDSPSTLGPEDPFGSVQAIEEYARTNLAETFAGLYLAGASDGQPGTIIVAFTDAPPAEHEQAMRELAGEQEITFRLVDYSLNELQTKQREIEQHFPELESQGVEIVSIGVNLPSNRVIITVTGDVAHAESILTERFGSNMIEVIAGEPVQLMPATSDANDAEIALEAAISEGKDDGTAKPGLLQRILNFLRAWWTRLFG